METKHKLVKEWFEELDEPFRSAAIKGWEETCRKEDRMILFNNARVASMAVALDYCIDWSDIPETTPDQWKDLWVKYRDQDYTKGIFDFLETIEDPDIRAKAIANTTKTRDAYDEEGKSQFDSIRPYSLFDAFGYCFDPDDNPEGRTFWIEFLDDVRVHHDGSMLYIRKEDSIEVLKQMARDGSEEAAEVIGIAEKLSSLLGEDEDDE